MTKEEIEELRDAAIKMADRLRTIYGKCVAPKLSDIELANSVEKFRPTPKKRVEGWVNIQPDGSLGKFFFATENGAKVANESNGLTRQVYLREVDPGENDPCRNQRWRVTGSENCAVAMCPDENGIGGQFLFMCDNHEAARVAVFEHNRSHGFFDEQKSDT